MADVRFLILCGPPSLDPSTVGYPPEEAEMGGWWYAWRLMASNNRRLARGVTSFAVRSVAVDAITRLRDAMSVLELRIVTDARDGSWEWYAEHAGVTVARCPHSYERERDCRGGFRRFLEAASRAQVAEGAVVLRDHRAPVSTHGKEASRWPAN
jgi:hypothetical protein